MNLQVEQVESKTPITILKIQGELDGSNYQNVVAKAQDIYAAGARRLIVDLGDTTYMSSSGLAALHMIAMLMRGEALPDPESGWDTFHSIQREVSQPHQTAVKILRPQPRVQRTLDTVGYTQFFEIYQNLPDALLSFSAGVPETKAPPVSG